MRTLCAGILLVASAAILPAAKNLEIYAIDVEGGQATLIVSPSGESMLVDTGWGAHNKRDAERIAAAAKIAGVKKIDYLVITHYHADHVGGIGQLAEKMPIRNFVDHGANVEDTKQGRVLFNEYAEFRAKGNHIEVKPGDTIPIKGIDVKAISEGGRAVARGGAGGRGMRRIPDARRRSHGKRAIGRNADHLRQFPHDRHGRPDVEQGRGPGVPGEQDRQGGSVPGVAPRNGYERVAAMGALAGTEGGADEQRRAQGRIAECLADHPDRKSTRL